MRSFICIAILFFCFSSAFAQNSHSYFTSPSAGDVVTSGQPVNLEWFPNQLESGQVLLSFWNLKIGQWQDIGYADYKSGSYIWTIPEDYNQKLRLRGVLEDGSIMYTSGYFSIVPPPAKVETQVPGITSAIDMTVHPNPSQSYARVCVEDLPAGIPFVAQVVNEAGEVVATLYNATPDAELGLCLTWDCSRVPSGTYFAHIMNANMGTSVKISVSH